MRYLVCALGSYGYLLPALDQARQLGARGHDVAVVTAAALADVVERQGLRRIPNGPSDDISFDVRHWGNVGEILRQVQHTLRACETFAPDALLVSNLALGPLAVARARGIPSATLGFGTYLWPKRDIPPEDQSPLDRERAGMHEMATTALETAAARVFGPRLVRPLSGDDRYRHSPLIGDLHLLRSIPALEPESSALSPRVHFVGSCLAATENQPDPELACTLARASAENRPVLFVQYFAGGGIPDYWPNLLAAVDGSGVQIVAATGRFALDTAGLPDHVFVRPHVDHQQILPHAAVVISNGTSSTMLGALIHGLPLLLLPFTSENPEVALRCERAGAAISLSPFDRQSGTPQPENITPEKLRAAINALLPPDSPQRRAARDLQQAFAALDARRPAPALVEALPLRSMVATV